MLAVTNIQSRLVIKNSTLFASILCSLIRTVTLFVHFVSQSILLSIVVTYLHT